MTVHVHVEDARTFKKEVVVKSRYFKAIVEESGHDRIDLVFEQHQVTHHYVQSTITLG